MAGKFGSASAYVLVDGYDLSASKLKGFSYKVEALHEDTTGIGDTMRNSIPTGVCVLTIKQEGGFFDTSTNGGHTALVTVATSPQGTPRVLVAGYAGQTLGEPYMGAEGVYQQAYDAISEGAKLTKANAEYAVSGQVDKGVILHLLGAETIDEDGASVNNSASSANGGAGVLQVTAYSGLTSAVIKIQDAPDDSTWADLIAFSAITSAPAAERSTVSGTVDQYLRYSINVTGTGSITFLVGFARF